MKKKIEKRRIVVYTGITFLITYLLEIGLIYPLTKNEFQNSQLMGTLLTYVAMLIPSVGVVLTRMLTKEGFRDCNIKPKKIKKTWIYYVLGWIVPSLLVLMGMILYFLIYPDNYDPEMNLFYTAINASGISFTKEQLKMLLIVQIIQATVTDPIVNFIFCFGEEWGWRGYLLPKLKDSMGINPALIVSGLIWGLWHMPLICMGHNYGMEYVGYPFTGIFAMCLFCVCVGAFLAFLTLKSGSCLPAVFTHGAINGMGTIGIYFTVDGGNPFIGPGVMGVIGGIGFIVTGVLSVVLLQRGKQNDMDSDR